MTKRAISEEGSAPVEKKQRKDQDNPELKVIEEAYQEALRAFKADKTNKDLRRAKSAAKQALDAAVAAASGGGEQLMCRDCSHKFIFTKKERDFYVAQGWDHSPTRCPKCEEASKARLEDRSKRDNNNGKNMCYAFQRGECTRGVLCRFSHDMKHSGKKSFEGLYQGPVKKSSPCFSFLKGNCKWGDQCRYSHDEPVA